MLFSFCEMYEGKSFQLFNLFSTLQKGQKLFYDLQQTIFSLAINESD